jgi:hypothetical protein
VHMIVPGGGLSLDNARWVASRSNFFVHVNVLACLRLHPYEFIKRFLLHVLPKGFHRIRHYGLFASTNRAESIATARALLDVVPPAADPQKQPDVAPDTPPVLPCPCPRCGARMIVIEVFASVAGQPTFKVTPRSRRRKLNRIAVNDARKIYTLRNVMTLSSRRA